MKVFAYGANMSVSAMQAKGVTPVGSEIGLLADFELCLRIPLFAPFRGHVADLRPTPGARVHGVLHTIRAADLGPIDEWEGLGWLYDVEEREIRVQDQTHRARVYVGNVASIGADGKCTQRYLTLLVEGARAAGLPQVALDALKALETLDAIEQRPQCLSDLTPMVDTLPPRWFELAGAGFEMQPSDRFGAYLDHSWTGSKTHLTSFFLRFVPDAPRHDQPVGTWAELSATQQRGLAPFLYEAERNLRFLGWTPRALHALKAA